MRTPPNSTTGPVVVPALAERRSTARTAAEHCADTAHEFAGAERLDHVVVGAQLEADYPVNFVVAGRDHDDGNVRSGTDAPAGLQAVDATRQAEVEEYQFRRSFGEQDQRPLAAAGQVGPMAVLTEVQVQEVGDVGVVLDDQDHGTVDTRRVT